MGPRPMKKRTGVIAGIGDTARGKDAAVSFTDDNGEDVNLDQCTSCGGNGKLLCCDGCVRSFHFSCLDPPMDPQLPPDGEWFCFECRLSREPHSKVPQRMLMSALVCGMDDRNPMAFHLPNYIRDFYESVKTGEEGEYEELYPSKKPKPGWEEAPNYTKLRGGTGDNTTILCFHCGKSSLGQREIIGCDFCHLHWHLDCLDPPMAAPPRKLNKFNWMCPNHIDGELQALYDPGPNPSTAHPVTGRSYKVRRPKHAFVKNVALRRGFRNNGQIEIENEPEEKEEGVIYRLPETGIKLDFIDRVKRANMESDRQLPNPRTRARDARRLHAAATRSAKAKAQRMADQKLKAVFDNRPFLDRQAALNLAQFSQSTPDLHLGYSEVENLIGTLIAEAPPDVAALFPDESVEGKEVSKPSSSITPPLSALSNAEKKTLKIIQELIRRRLAGPDGEEAS
ncbi:hypothetical protein MMC07_005345 [Pseudocyphellaria aurata]|nr:hypothetical protein [Pseudocyphellaria aurata]